MARLYTDATDNVWPVWVGVVPGDPGFRLAHRVVRAYMRGH